MRFGNTPFEVFIIDTETLERGDLQELFKKSYKVSQER